VRDGLPDHNIFSLMRTGGSRGPLWVGTGGSGIVRLEPGLWTTFAEPDGLPNRNVLGIGEASFDGVGRTHWIGTVDGAVYRNASVWQPVLPEPWRQQNVHAILPRAAGGLWLGTDSGLLSLDKGVVTVRNLQNSRLPGLATRHGIAWVEGDMPQAPKIDGIDLTAGARDFVVAPTIAGGSLFIVQNGVNWLRADGTAARLSEACLGHRDVVAAAARGSTLWVAGRGGLRRIRFEGIRHTCEAVDNSALDGVWINALAVLPDGDLFIASSANAYRLHAVNGEVPIPVPRVERFGPSDALASPEFRRATYVDSAGRLWAANAAGAVMLQTDNDAANDVGAKLVLKAASSSGTRIEPHALVPYGQDVSLEWRLLSFAREAHIRYRWRLAGLRDVSEGTWSTEHRVQLPRLPARAYQLEVWAKDANDVEYGPLTFGFAVDKPWWQREWVVLVAALALVAMGLGLGRWRSRILHQRAAQLESVVRTRTRELSQANQRLEHSAMTDALTGALNRRALFEQFAVSTEGGVRTVLLMDIDHFKRINDTYGHAAGDAVLKALVARLGDLGQPLFRLGGEEFLLLASGFDDAGMTALCGRVLRTMASAPIHTGDGAFDIDARVSIGACRFVPSGHPDALEAAIQVADAGLYRAKNSGRNRAMLATGALATAMLTVDEIKWQQVMGEELPSLAAAPQSQ
jgi:diguanylate cyclase (GGDEF)-like protein